MDAIYSEEVIINNTDVFNFIPKDVHHLKYLKPILAILSTSVCSTYFKTTNVNLNRQAFPKLNVNNILEFPLPQRLNDDTLNYLSERVDLILSFNINLQSHNKKFQRTIQRKFNLEDLPKKLQEWYLLTYAEFINELAKKKVKLTLSEEAEWEDYFETESKKAKDLKAQIDKTDKEIDNMVYELYELSEEEIRIVENS